MSGAPQDPVDVMARTIWGEARGEGRAGMEAVGNVIMNRANNPRWWGRDVISVCQAPWQFSAWNPDDINRRLLLAVTEADAQFRTCLEIARSGIGGTLRDHTHNSDHFHEQSIRPLWSQGRQHTVHLGRHRFFRLELRPPT